MLKFLFAFLFTSVSFAADLKLVAKYVVPPMDGVNASEEARSFTVQYVVKTASNGKETTTFVLPQELTGRKISTDLKVIEKTEVDGVVMRTLSGKLGIANCEGAWEKARCQYQFKNLNINETDVQDFLKSNFSEGSDRFKELEAISLGFSADPIGEILMIPSAFTISSFSN